MTEPTNNDLLKEIKAIHSVLDDHEQRLKPLEQWKIAYDAADAAITKYKQEHNEVRAAAELASNRPGLLTDGLNKEFVKLLTAIVGVLAALAGVIYLIAQNLLK